MRSRDCYADPEHTEETEEIKAAPDPQRELGEAVIKQMSRKPSYEGLAEKLERVADDRDHLLAKIELTCALFGVDVDANTDLRAIFTDRMRNVSERYVAMLRERVEAHAQKLISYQDQSSAPPPTLEDEPTDAS